MSALQGTGQQAGSETEMFLMEGSVHLRYSRFGEDRLHLVKSLSFTGGKLLVQWTKEAADQGLPPQVEQRIDIYAIRQGVLLISQGTVIELRPGPQLRVSLKVAPHGRRVCLRKHQRYIVRGRLSLGPAGEEFNFVQPTDQEMDVSLGGFGCRLPETALCSQPADGLTRVSLELYAERRGRINPELPSVTLNCYAELRRSVAHGGCGEVQVGYQFTNLSSNQQETLETWLATNRSQLREC